MLHFFEFELIGFFGIRFETHLHLITRTCEVYLGFSFVKKILAIQVVVKLSMTFYSDKTCKISS